MASPLSGIAAAVHGALKGIFFDAVLTRQVVLPTSPAYDPADPPAPTSVNYACKALRDRYSISDMANSSILQGDVKILILANSLSVSPMKDDIITIKGASFSTIAFDIDPADASWVIQGRK